MRTYIFEVKPVENRKPIRREETIPIPISAEDRALIKNHTFIDLELEEMLDNARTEWGMLILDIKLEDLDLLLEFIAAEINHTEDADLEKELVEIYDRLSDIKLDYEIIEYF